MFDLSKMTKISLVVGAASLALFGLGYAITSVTGLIDEVTENNHSQPKFIEMKEMPPYEDEDDSFKSDEDDNRPVSQLSESDE